MNNQQVGLEVVAAKRAEELIKHTTACEEEVAVVLSKYKMGIAVTIVEVFTPDGGLRKQVQLSFVPHVPA